MSDFAGDSEKISDFAGKSVILLENQ